MLTQERRALAESIQKSHTLGMTLTTIKVDAGLRDRLKVQAARKGLTIGALLEQLLEIAEREARFEDLSAAIARTSPEHMASWNAETALWDDAELLDPGDRG